MDEGKVHPIASDSGEKLGAIAMPANVIRDADGSSRVILSEPTGCTAEVCIFFLNAEYLLSHVDLFIFLYMNATVSLYFGVGITLCACSCSIPLPPFCLLLLFVCHVYVWDKLSFAYLRVENN